MSCVNSINTRFPLMVALTISIIFLVLQPAMAWQEPATSKTYQELLAEWTAMDAKLKEQEAAVSSGDPEAAEAFATLVSDANNLLAELKQKVLDGLQQDPENREMLRTILGIAINDAFFGREEEVFKISRQLIANKINPRYFEIAAGTERLSIAGRELFEELAIRAREAIADDNPIVKLVTSQGEMQFELFENQAPNTVNNFIYLIEKGFYDGLKFHRVLEGFMAQTGCPQANGTGGPGYMIKCECLSPDARRHFVGTLSMANQGVPNTGGSQFFLTFDRTSGLDGKHTVFGRIIEGQDVLAKINRTHILINRNEQPIPDVTPDTIIDAVVVRKRDHEYVPEEAKTQAEEKPEDSPSPPKPSTPDPSEGDGDQPKLNDPAQSKSGGDGDNGDGGDNGSDDGDGGNEEK